jgi:predicted nucleotidyltransferase
MRALELKINPGFTVLDKLPFGSHIYGTNKPDSDLDLICLIKESTGHFVLRYKNEQDNTDNTYVGVNEFISGLANCSNVEFFEAIHTDIGQAFLERHNLKLMDYYNSRQAKAYLGIAARDLHYIARFRHVIRCIVIAKNIIKKQKISLESLQKEIIDFTYVDDHSNITIKQHIQALRKELVYAD